MKKFQKPSDDELRKKLTPLQYQVTQGEATEPPVNNEFYEHDEEGIYVDVVSGEPLFSSNDKYHSTMAWPSFTKPIEETNVTEKKDFKLLIPRTEVRSKNADSHLGHVFDDGPPEAGGKHYCINSAALKFVPKDKLDEEGYGQYTKQFE